jgi:PAS domain S-box-containing protein
MNEKLNILVVEDNPGDVDLILEMLAKASPARFKVESASRLSEAFGRLESGGIDVVLLDLGLPDSRGLDTLRVLKGAAPHVPIVVYTGCDDEATGQAAVREGAQDYLVKGALSERMLARVLCYAVERHQGEQVRSASLERQERLNLLQQALLGPGEMVWKLRMITDGVVDIFGADFSRIWCIASGDLCEHGCMHAATDEGPHACSHRDRCLHLIASSGWYTHTDDAANRRVPFGIYKIGRVASGEEHKYLTNDVTGDPNVRDHDWARELGLISFAAYQLRPPGGETLGVLALFRKHAMTAEEDAQLDGLSASAARVIQAAQAQETLRESEKKYQFLYETMTQGVFYQRADGVLVDANPAALSMFGLTHEKLVGRTSFHPPWDVIHEDGSPFPTAEHPSMVALKTGKPVKDVVAGVFNPQTKSYVWLAINAVPKFRQEEAVVDGVFVTLHDITPRKRAEEALRQAESKYRSIFDNAVEGIFQATPEGKFLSVNPAFARMCGFEDPEEMVSTITDIKTQLYANPEDRTRIAALYEGLGIVRNFETQFRKTDGRFIWVSVNSRAVRDERGSMLYYEGTIEDISERKRAEEEQTLIEAQLRQAQKMEALGTLAGGIAHDFNNILGIITGYAEMAEMDAGEGSALRSTLIQVLKAASRAKDLVQQILAFARQGEHELKPVQIGLIVKEAGKMLRASLPSTIDIKLNVHSKTAVLADPTQIHQVMMNLCTNAAHAMSADGGALEVSLTDTRLGMEPIHIHSGLEPGPYVKLTIKDTGHGIDPAVLDRIFDPFFTTKGQGVGTGLGLAVVHGIVKNHGGAIEVESILGKGSIFQVFLPAMESAPVPEKAESAPLPRGCERILIVDDEPALMEAMKRFLEQLGYVVDSRTSSIEALEAFRSRMQEKPFDLVVTDMTMPHLTGLDLARELLRLQPNLPIILSTGFSEKVGTERARDFGIRGFLMKPVALKELAGMIRKKLDESMK